MQTLKIEIVHDLVCSWCPIGYANLQTALNNLNIKADMHFLPFELNPKMEAEGEAIDRHLAQRYGWSENKRRDYRTHLLAVAQDAGVSMDFSKRTHYYNTHQGHKIMHLAQSHNKQQAMNELFINAYFTLGLDISNTQVLLGLAVQVGLDRVEAEKALISKEVDHAMSRKQKRVQQLGLSSVPAFIFNNSMLVNGSNSVEYFEQVLVALTQKETA